MAREPTACLLKAYRLGGRYNLLANALSWLGIAWGVMALVVLAAGVVYALTTEGMGDLAALLAVLAIGVAVVECVALSRLTAGEAESRSCGGRRAASLLVVRTPGGPASPSG